MRIGQHYFPEYALYYRGYGLTNGDGGRCSAMHDTPELYDKCDYPNIGLGWPVDKGRSYNLEEMKQRIDEVIAERERRIGWVKKFAQTQKKPDWTERYLLESCDPNNDDGHRGRSHHTEAELYHMWSDGIHYYMRWGMGFVEVSKTKYLYRQYLIERGYIEDKD